MRCQATTASSLRVPILVVLLLIAGANSVARAQAPSEAAQIIETFGTGGTLSEAGMKKYLRSVEFLRLDVDKSGSLDADEYVSAQLYARPPACGNDNVRETWLEENKQGPVDATRLYDGNPLWKIHIDETAKAQWTRAAKGQTSINEAQLAAFLVDERTRRNRVPTAAERLKSLSGGQEGNISLAQFATFFLSEWFANADGDASGSLAFAEFTRVATYLTAAIEFCTLAGDDGLVTRADIADASRMSTDAPALQIQLVRLGNAARQKISPLVQIPLQRAKTVFEDEERLAAERAKAAALSPHGFVPGRGFLISGTRQLSPAKEISWNQNEPAVFLRVIKDFTVDDPLKAEPALFTIQGERDKETTFAIDTTVQLDYYPASFQLLRLAGGIDIERQTGSSGSNVETYYGTVHLFFWQGGSLESSYFTFSPNVEDDRTKEQTTFAGDLLWQPGLRFGSFVTNLWRPISRKAFWYVTPRAALEIGEVVRSANPADEPDVTNARIEIIGGIRIGPRFTTTYRGLRRFAFGDSAENSGYQEFALRWSFDEYDRFSLKASAADGRKTTTATDKGTFSIGIGVKF